MLSCDSDSLWMNSNFFFIFCVTLFCTMYIEGGSSKNPPMGINMILLFIPLFSDQNKKKKVGFLLMLLSQQGWVFLIQGLIAYTV